MSDGVQFFRDRIVEHTRRDLKPCDEYVGNVCSGFGAELTCWKCGWDSIDHIKRGKHERPIRPSESLRMRVVEAGARAMQYLYNETGVDWEDETDKTFYRGAAEAALDAMFDCLTENEQEIESVLLAYRDLLANGQRVEWCEEHRASAASPSSMCGRFRMTTPCRVVSRLLVDYPKEAEK